MACYFPRRRAKPLEIFGGGVKFILRITVSAFDRRLQPLSPVAQSRPPFLREERDGLIH